MPIAHLELLSPNQALIVCALALLVLLFAASRWRR